MNANELADAMEIRASIRRKATSRKSVQEGANDRLADQLDQAATMLRQQQEQIDKLTAIVALRELKIERMIEKQSHYEAMAHAGGFEAGRQQAFFDRAREVAKQIDNNEYHTPED